MFSVEVLTHRCSLQQLLHNVYLLCMFLRCTCRTMANMLVFGLIFLCFCILCIFSWLNVVVSTSAIDCLERLVSEMNFDVLSGTLNPNNYTVCFLLLYMMHHNLIS